MVKPLQRSEIRSFTGGWVSDSNRLESPSDAARAEVNFDCNLDGSRSRRKGFEVDSLESMTRSELSWAAVPLVHHNHYIWESPGGAIGMAILVVHIGPFLYFYDARAARTGEAYIDKIQAYSSLSTSRIDLASVQGYLIAVWGETSFMRISYDPATRTISHANDVRITIRDVFGVEETMDSRYELDVNFRGSLNTRHYYNLYNQGWAIPRLPWLFGDNPLQDAVALARGSGAEVPSNSDVVWQGMDFRTIGRETLGTPPAEGEPGDQSFIYTTAEAFNRKLYQGTAVSEFPAGKGFFIIDAFARGLSRRFAWNDHVTKYPQTGQLLGGGSFISLPDDVTNAGPTCVAAHAGRLFYSGILDGGVTQSDRRSPDFSNYVFFSQIVKFQSDLAKCYQEGDPTSREGSEVIDTDGGFIRVSGAVGIRRMVPLGHRLLILASNGVWAIVGTEGGGFTATNFTVEKVSNFGCVAPSSVVVDGKSIYYWGQGAVYRLAPNQFGELEVADLTTQSLKQVYAGIFEFHKVRCSGTINKHTNVIHWIFSNNESNALDSQKITEFRFDISRNALFHMEWAYEPESLPMVLGSFMLSSTSYYEVNGGVAPVGGFAPPNTLKYWGIRKSVSGFVDIFFGEYTDELYRDWRLFTGGVGVDAKAIILTWDITGGDFSIEKEIVYLTMVMRNSTFAGGSPSYGLQKPASLLGRVQWDFANGTQANRWGSIMQLFRPKRVYNVDPSAPTLDGYEIVYSKTKLRGNGKTFCLYLETEPDKDCHIYGWSITATSNGVT